MTESAVAVIGDVGGHRRCLETALGRLGVDLDGAELPEGLVVVQVGDLVGGRDDGSIVADVARLMERYPDRWIQLVGNWEAQFLGGPEFVRGGADSRVDPHTIEAVRRLWRDGRLRPAVAVGTASGAEVLVTHAGVTREFWQRDLGEPSSASDAVDAIEQLVRRAPAALFRPGELLAGHRAAGAPGPLWAMASTEAWPSWLDEPPPFGQVHGHTSPYWFGGRRWNDEVSVAVRDRARVVGARRHVWFEAAPGRRIVGIDPGLGRRPRGDELHALVLTGAKVLPVTAPAPT